VRDALHRRRSRRMPSDALLFLSMAASVWSMMSGTIVVMALEALQQLVA
jgi:hypothetical protein